MDHEAHNYRTLERFIHPWAPKFYGSFGRVGWHVLLLEDLGPRSVPPWTYVKARNAARSYARFHRMTWGKRLPRSLSRTDYVEYARFWRTLGKTGELARTASLAGRRAAEAEEWLAVALPVLIAHERELERARPPFALLHFDTRSDNVRIQGDRCPSGCRRDRKSTRLNSSHVATSYAVFCLKKKTTNWLGTVKHCSDTSINSTV